MDSDLMIVLGVVAIVLAVPSLLSSWVEGSVPRTGSLLVLAGGVLIMVAVTRTGNTYHLADMPDVFMRVIGRFFK